jgi:anti-sigma factor RsiW
MTCREFIQFMMDYSEGSLPEAQRAAFDLHLAHCSWCRDYLRTYQETVRLGKAAAQPATDDDLPEELVKAILAARASDK